MKNSRHTVVVDSLANSGDGVGRINDKIIFIPYACPGDELLIEITQDKKSFFRGKILEVLHASSERVSPRCEIFGECGGCDWQHIGYESQLKWKFENLKQSLSRIGKFSELDFVKEPQSSPQTFNYRNRIQVKYDSGNFHFNRRGSHSLIKVEKCDIAEESINQYLLQNRPTHSGKIELASMKNNQVQEFKVDKKGHSQLGFRQVNTEQNNWIGQKIVDWLKSKEVKHLADLYCGQGNWALLIGKKFPEIQCVGIEENPISVKKAKSENIPNCEFLQGDAEKLFREKVHSFDGLILDPPRKGCSSSLIQTINDSSLESLIYISCDPGTLSRDLGLLCQSHWVIDEIYPVDMFPQTSHLECLCFLHSAKGSNTAKY